MVRSESATEIAPAGDEHVLPWLTEQAESLPNVVHSALYFTGRAIAFDPVLETADGDVSLIAVGWAEDGDGKAVRIEYDDGTVDTHDISAGESVEETVANAVDAFDSFDRFQARGYYERELVPEASDDEVIGVDGVSRDSWT